MVFPTKRLINEDKYSHNKQTTSELLMNDVRQKGNRRNILLVLNIKLLYLDSFISYYCYLDQYQVIFQVARQTSPVITIQS